MARRVIPDPLERRHLLEKKLDPAPAARVAEAYLATGRTVEALAFLKAAGAVDRLESLLTEAVASGDSFLLREVAKALGRPPTSDEWRALADAAATAGKLLYADQARRQIGKEG